MFVCDLYLSLSHCPSQIWVSEKPYTYLCIIDYIYLQQYNGVCRVACVHEKIFKGQIGITSKPECITERCKFLYAIMMYKYCSVLYRFLGQNFLTPRARAHTQYYLFMERKKTRRMHISNECALVYDHYMNSLIKQTSFRYSTAKLMLIRPTAIFTFSNYMVWICWIFVSYIMIMTYSYSHYCYMWYAISNFPIFFFLSYIYYYIIVHCSG